MTVKSKATMGRVLEAYFSGGSVEQGLAAAFEAAGVELASENSDWEPVDQRGHPLPAQPPASGEPAEGYREELVKFCLDAGLPESYISRSPAATARKIAELDRALSEEIDERDRNAEWADKLAFAIQGLTGVEIGEHSNANNPWRVALEAAESPLPADWREAVEGALPCSSTDSGAALCGDGDHLDCPRDHLPAVLRALAPLVLAERLRAERLRRALERCEASERSESGMCTRIVREPKPNTTAVRSLLCGSGQHVEDCPYSALAADPPDAALAELLGLPGRLTERARKAQGEAERHPDRVRRHYCDGQRQAHDEDARAVAAVLAKLGLPAGEEAGDG